MENLLAPEQCEFTLKLDGCRPDEMPLSQLARYMAKFATLLGDDAVRFSEIVEGSTQIAVMTRPDIVPEQINSRLLEASSGRGPKRFREAYEELSRMTANDGLQASVHCGEAVVLSTFPEPTIPQEKQRVLDDWLITGRLRGVIGAGDGKPVKVRISPVEGGPLVHCTASEELGRDLAQSFLKMVRIEGRALWVRSEDGTWQCEDCRAETAREVKDATLKDAILEIRNAPIEWCDDPFAGYDEE